MAVQTPPLPPAPDPHPGPAGPGLDPEIEAGVIRDARIRQRRQRRAAGVLVSAVVIGALIAGFGGGSGGASGHSRGGYSGSNPGSGPAHASASSSFPGAPVSQRGLDIDSDVCPLAPANRYLPAHSGCVMVRRGDVNGDGRRDLIIVYSRLSSRHSLWVSTSLEPSEGKREYGAEAAFLKVVFANGASLITRIGGTPDGFRTSTVDAIAHVGADSGDEIFLEINRISSGATGVAYGLHDGRLVSAGPLLSYNGDSGTEAGFNCVAGNPPRLIQRYFTFVGPNELTRSWRETSVVYAWHGPKLVELSKRTVKGLVALRPSEAGVGQGCIRGVS